MSEIIEVAKDFAKLTLRKRELEEQIKALNGQITEAGKKILALNQEAGLERIPLEDLGTVSFRDDITTTVVDDAALKNWLEEHELGHLAKWSVHHGTLGAFIKERLAAGATTPEGVEFNRFTRVSLVQR